jgi:hypothetical protein
MLLDSSVKSDYESMTVMHRDIDVLVLTQYISYYIDYVHQLAILIYLCHRDFILRFQSSAWKSDYPSEVPPALCHEEVLFVHTVVLPLGSNYARKTQIQSLMNLCRASGGAI